MHTCIMGYKHKEHVTTLLTEIHVATFPGPSLKLTKGWGLGTKLNSTEIHIYLYLIKWEVGVSGEKLN